jgi:hypothetical protein
VGACGLALLDHRHRDLTQALGELRLTIEQLHQPDRTGEAGRTAAHDRHPDLDPLVFGIDRLGDELLHRVCGRRKLGRRDGH